jgi:hypothetical protein
MTIPTSDSAYDLEALTVCEAVKHWRCYLEGCSKFLVVLDHDTLPHLLTQPNNMVNERQARYLRGLQPSVGTMTLAYRKGAFARCTYKFGDRILHFRPQFIARFHREGEQITTEVPAAV